MDAQDEARTQGDQGVVSAIAVAAEVRGLVERLVSVDAADATLREAARLVARARSLLDGPERPMHQPSGPDRRSLPGLRAHGLVVGTAHPFAPPLRIAWDGPHVVARFSLGRAYEGPRGHAHGGISALVLDEVTAKVRPLIGTGRVTRVLTVRYRRPVPLRTELIGVASLVSRSGRDAIVKGSIAAEAAPDVALVTAETHFVVPGRDDDMDLGGATP